MRMIDFLPFRIHRIEMQIVLNQMVSLMEASTLMKSCNSLMEYFLSYNWSMRTLTCSWYQSPQELSFSQICFQSFWASSLAFSALRLQNSSFSSSQKFYMFCSLILSFLCLALLNRFLLFDLLLVFALSSSSSVKYRLRRVYLILVKRLLDVSPGVFWRISTISQSRISLMFSVVMSREFRQSIICWGSEAYFFTCCNKSFIRSFRSILSLDYFSVTLSLSFWRRMGQFEDQFSVFFQFPAVDFISWSYRILVTFLILIFQVTFQTAFSLTGLGQTSIYFYQDYCSLYDQLFYFTTELFLPALVFNCGWGFFLAEGSSSTSTIVSVLFITECLLTMTCFSVSDQLISTKELEILEIVDYFLLIESLTFGGFLIKLRWIALSFKWVSASNMDFASFLFALPSASYWVQPSQNLTIFDSSRKECVVSPKKLTLNWISSRSSSWTWETMAGHQGYPLILAQTTSATTQLGWFCIFKYYRPVVQTGSLNEAHNLE